MKILLGDFNANMEREKIVKPTIGNESLHRDGNDNGVIIIHFATSKHLVVESTKTFISEPGPLLMGRLTTT
jgi:hypothetical protein